MRKVLLNSVMFIVPCLYATNSLAGDETLLLETHTEHCSIRILHESTAFSSRTGTIIFKSYRTANGLHEPCTPSREQVRRSLDSAFRVYLRKDLKPVTSIYIGHLSQYPWISDFLATQPRLIGRPPWENRINIFKQRRFLHQTLNPFKQAINLHGYRIVNTRCEKIITNRQDNLEDALCWLLIQPRTETNEFNSSSVEHAPIPR